MDDPVALGTAQLVRLHGADARRFAHAQFCSDVDALANDDWQWSAWLDAKGRVRTFFALIARGNDELLAWLPLGDAAAMAAELRRFVFRCRLAIDRIEGWQLRGSGGCPADAPRTRQGDEAIGLRLDGAKTRYIELVRGAEAPVDDQALRHWRGCDAGDRLPLIDAACSDEFVPQALELERLGAISFKKGCYPGQEIVARLHFRGGNKRGLRTLRWAAGASGASIGVPVHDTGGGDAVGRLLYVGDDAHGAVGLAVINDAVDAHAELSFGAISGVSQERT